MRQKADVLQYDSSLILFQQCSSSQQLPEVWHAWESNIYNLQYHDTISCVTAVLPNVSIFFNVAVILNVKADFLFFVGLSLCKLYSFYNDVQNNT